MVTTVLQAPLPAPGFPSSLPAMAWRATSSVASVVRRLKFNLSACARGAK